MPVAMVSRDSGVWCSQGPRKEEIYRQCLSQSQLVALLRPPHKQRYNFVVLGAREDYLLRQTNGVEVDSSGGGYCGTFAGEADDSLDRVFVTFGPGAPAGTSCLTSATGSLAGCFLAITGARKCRG